MKKRVGLIITIVIAALIVCLLIWRFWPHSSARLLSVDENTITGFSAYAMVRRIENGQSYTDTYRLDDPAQQGNTPEEIVKILAASHYQQDFRNLLPWGIDSVASDKNYDGRTVTLNFYFQNAENESVEILFLSSSIIVVQAEKHPMRIYHPTNAQTLDKLIAYVQAHGIIQ